jgi:hypothetical protein
MMARLLRKPFANTQLEKFFDIHRLYKRDGRWEMGDGRWEMGDGRWEMGDGRWEMGDGRI